LNDAGENTYFILGEISEDGNEWEECILIWGDDFCSMKKG
jgi:hypothetical protein